MPSRCGRLVTVLTSLCALSLAACGSDVATGGTGASDGSERTSPVPPKTPPWKPVTVHFTNTHKAPYYRGGGGCSGDAFSITDAKGRILPSSSKATAPFAAGTDTSVEIAS